MASTPENQSTCPIPIGVPGWKEPTYCFLTSEESKNYRALDQRVYNWLQAIEIKNWLSKKREEL